MARIVLDPEEVNQVERFTLTDGEVVELAGADAGVLRRVARQLHVHRTGYASAFASDDDELQQRVRSGAEDVAAVAPLYLHVADLLDRARKAEGRGAATLDLDLLVQDQVWTSTSGRTRPLDELTPTHRRNLLGWLERNSDALRDRFTASPPDAADRLAPAEPWVAGTPLFQRLQALVDAESARELAVDKARQVVRQVEFERSGEWPDR